MLIGGISSQTNAVQSNPRPAQELASPISVDAASKNTNVLEKQPGTFRPVSDTQKSAATGNYSNRKVKEVAGKADEEERQTADSERDETAKDSGNAIRQQLTPEDLQIIRELSVRDRQVRAHEQAHLAAAGGLAQGGASFSYQTGPDGQRYAVGGEVAISVASSSDPRENIANAQQLRRAALAPADPSAQDRSVAARAVAMQSEAQAALVTAQREETQAAVESRVQANKDQTGAEKTSDTSSSNQRQAAGTNDAFLEDQRKAEKAADDARAERAAEEARSQEARAQREEENARSQQARAELQAQFAQDAARKAATQTTTSTAVSEDKKVAEKEPVQFSPVLGSVPDPDQVSPQEVSLQVRKAFKNAIENGRATPRLGERFSEFA